MLQECLKIVELFLLMYFLKSGWGLEQQHHLPKGFPGNEMA